MPETVHVVCPHCDAVNRAPREKLRPGVRGKCGRCGGPLFEGRPIALTGARFDRHARESDIPLLVDFWAPWCGPCRTMAPMFERAAARLEPRVRLAKVNTDDEPELAARFGIRGIPTLVLVRHGREVARQTGAMDGDAIEPLGEPVRRRLTHSAPLTRAQVSSLSVVARRRRGGGRGGPGLRPALRRLRP